LRAAERCATNLICRPHSSHYSLYVVQSEQFEHSLTSLQSNKSLHIYTLAVQSKSWLRFFLEPLRNVFPSSRNNSRVPPADAAQQEDASTVRHQ